LRRLQFASGLAAVPAKFSSVSAPREPPSLDQKPRSEAGRLNAEWVRGGKRCPKISLARSTCSAQAHVAEESVLLARFCHAMPTSDDPA
jgi:hypothetical protein